MFLIYGCKVTLFLLTAKLFGIFFEVLLEKLLENLFFIHLLAIFAPDKPFETIVGKTYLIKVRLAASCANLFSLYEKKEGRPSL